MGRYYLSILPAIGKLKEVFYNKGMEVNIDGLNPSNRKSWNNRLDRFSNNEK